MSTRTTTAQTEPTTATAIGLFPHRCRQVRAEGSAAPASSVGGRGKDATFGGGGGGGGGEPGGSAAPGAAGAGGTSAVAVGGGVVSMAGPDGGGSMDDGRPWRGGGSTERSWPQNLHDSQSGSTMNWQLLQCLTVDPSDRC